MASNLMDSRYLDIVYSIIFVITHTEARREEIKTLKWIDVDFEDGFIILRKSKNGYSSTRIFNASASSLRLRLYGILEFQPSKATIEYHLIRLQQLNPDMKPWKVHDLRHSFAHNYLKSSRCTSLKLSWATNPFK
jgi:integrase